MTFPPNISDLLHDEKFFGRMNDPTCAATLTGPCGDGMEFYLVLRDGRVEEIKYYTEGCEPTKACAAMTAHLALGKTPDEVLSISAGDVIEKLKGLPEGHLHCSILAVSTLYRAMADYLLRH